MLVLIADTCNGASEKGKAVDEPAIALGKLLPDYL